MRITGIFSSAASTCFEKAVDMQIEVYSYYQTKQSSILYVTNDEPSWLVAVRSTVIIFFRDRPGASVSTFSLRFFLLTKSLGMMAVMPNGHY